MRTAVEKIALGNVHCNSHCTKCKQRSNPFTVVGKDCFVTLAMTIYDNRILLTFEGDRDIFCLFRADRHGLIHRAVFFLPRCDRVGSRRQAFQAE